MNKIQMFIIGITFILLSSTAPIVGQLFDDNIDAMTGQAGVIHIEEGDPALEGPG
jgi:hypothetical protein